MRAVLAAEFAFLFLWSSGFIGAKYGLPHAGTFTLLFFRYLALSLILVAWLGICGKLRRIGSAGQIRHAAVMGFLAHCVWLVAALKATELGVSPGVVALVAALQPMVTGAVVGPVLGEKVSRWQWIGLAAGFIGVMLVVWDQVDIGGDAPWWAYAIPFISTLSLTASTVYQRAMEIRSSEGFLPVMNNLAVQCFITVIVLAPFAAGLEGMEADWNADLVFALAWLTLVVSLAAYGLLIFLIKKCPATRVASLLYLTPPVTMVMDYFAFGNYVTVNGMAGLAIAAVGVFLVHRGEATRKPSAPSTPSTPSD